MGPRGFRSCYAEAGRRQWPRDVVVVASAFVVSIVVDDVETVKRCIDYLKEQKWHAMTFLPLESITAQAPDQRSALAGCF